MAHSAFSGCSISTLHLCRAACTRKSWNIKLEVVVLHNNHKNIPNLDDILSLKNELTSNWTK